MRLLIVTQAVDRKNQVLGFFVDWIIEFSKNFSFVTVICLEKGIFEPVLNTQVLSLGKEEGVSKIKYLFRFYKYILQARKEYDVVFVHMNPIYVVLGGIIWKILGKRVGLWYTHKQVDFKLRIATFLAHVIFSASAESFRLNTPKLVVTGHGIDISKFNQQSKFSPDEKIHLLSVGRISEIKQTLKALYILQSVLEKHDAILSIVGNPISTDDQLYFSQLKEYVLKSNLEDKVFFLGNIPNTQIEKVFTQGSILLHTSKTGSLDKVVLEAFASRVLVISESIAFKDILDMNGLFIVNGTVTEFMKKICDIKEAKLDIYKITEDNYIWVSSKHSLVSLVPKIKKELSKI